MNWNQDKSVKLSRLCVKLFFLVWLIGCVLAPRLFRFFIAIRGARLQGTLVYFLVTTYVLSIPVILALYRLSRLLENISREQVFTEENVRHLRGLSWCCLLTAIICLASCLYYGPFAALAALAGFMNLILRVVKNAFAEAVILKQENDYTI